MGLECYEFHAQIESVPEKGGALYGFHMAFARETS